MSSGKWCEPFIFHPVGPLRGSPILPSGKRCEPFLCHTVGPLRGFPILPSRKQCEPFLCHPIAPLRGSPILSSGKRCEPFLCHTVAHVRGSLICCCMFQTPLHVAALDNKPQFTRLLLQSHADINSQDASGQTPVDLAAKNRSEETVTVIQEEMGE